MMAFPFITLLQFRALDPSPYPAIQGYIRRIEVRPAYRRAMERAGPGRKAGLADGNEVTP